MTEEEPTQKKPRFKPPQGTPRYILSDFKGLVPIEQGGGGLVSKGRLGDYGKIALKQFLYSEETQDKFKREIEILIERRHPNIIHLYGVLWDGLDASRYLGYVMEYLEGGSLKNIIYDPTNEYDRAQINRWIEQIARGIQFLHNYGIVHRDIKPDNILVAGEQLKLADFGVAKNVDGTTTAGGGTYFYMAPEMVAHGKSSFMADIYSLAITIWEIFHRKRPYLELGNLSLYMLSAYIINGARPRIEWNKMNFDVAELIQKCWTPNPIYRPPIREVAEFFEGKSFSRTVSSLTERQPVDLEADLNVIEDNGASVDERGKTILITGKRLDDEIGRAALTWNSDRSKWMESDLDLPISPFDTGVVCLDEEIYAFGGARRNKVYKLNSVTGDWIQLADTNIVRYFSRCTNVAFNGYIWVFGGEDIDYTGYKSVERYDPKENKWTVVSYMKHIRSNASAVVWNNRIVVSGGCQQNCERTNTVECFNPENGIWTELPDMPTKLSWHSSVSYNHKIIVFGGTDGHLDNSRVWQLDPLEDEPNWRELPRMKFPRDDLAGIVFGEEIYAVGGCQFLQKAINQVEIFDGKQWRLGPSLPYPIQYVRATIIPKSFEKILEEGEKQAANSLASDQSITIPMRQTPQANTILVIGRTYKRGNRLIVWNSDKSKWVETDIRCCCLESGVVYVEDEIYLVGGDHHPEALYKLDNNLNRLQLADMTVDRPRATRATVVFNGHIWVFGGQDENGNCLKSVERYDPKEDKWMSMPDMIHERSNASAVVWDNRFVVVTGGVLEDANRTNTAEYFSLKDGCWAELPDMPTDLVSHSLVSRNGKIIILGGFKASFNGTNGSSSVWELDPLEEEPEWRPLPRMKYPSAAFAGIVYDEEIYAIGGYQRMTNEEEMEARGMNRVEIFDGKKWRLGPFLPCPLRDVSALVIPQTLADALIIPQTLADRFCDNQ